MTNQKGKIVALYVRVSTGYQVDKDSLPFQKKELKAYCEHVLHVDKKRIEVFEDAGKSGKNTKRPAFERMMEKVKAGKVSHVVVYKIDRITRNLVDFSLMYDDFKYNNVTFISLNEQFDTSSAIGEAILKIILVFAELERKLTSERVTDVMIGRAQSGQWNGARVPYGWDWDAENKCPVHSKDRRRGNGFRPSSYACTGKYQKKHCDNLNVSDVKIGPFMINYIAAIIDASKSRRFIKDTESLERVILSHIDFTDVAGISESSLQDTIDLLYGRSGTETLSGKPVSKDGKNTDTAEKKKELQEKLQKTDRALERLKKAYLFDDDAMDEKEFLEMKTKLEVDKVKLENSIKSLDSSSISENVDQAAFIKSASQFLISHKINSGGNIEYSELAMMDEEAMKTLMNSIIDHITVMDRHITEIVFKNGLTHTLLYR